VSVGKEGAYSERGRDALLILFFHIAAFYSSSSWISCFLLSILFLFAQL